MTNSDGSADSGTERRYSYEDGLVDGYEAARKDLVGSEADGPDDRCPACSGELVDYRSTEQEEIHGRRVSTPFDYICSECHKTWDVAAA